MVRLPTDALGLDGAPEHPLYPLGLAMAAFDAASHGDRVDAERLCDEALAGSATSRFRPRPTRRTVDLYGPSGKRLRGRERFWMQPDSQSRLRRSAGQPASSVLSRVGSRTAAVWYTMAGDPDTALSLATEGLAVARRLGNPNTIGLNLAALAGALADSDPNRAAALLHEDIERWACAAATSTPRRSPTPP